jgi:hypothetical protein
LLGCLTKLCQVEAEDEITAVVAVGVRGTQVRLYNKRKFDPGDGFLDLDLGAETVVSVANTHISGVPSQPVGRVSVDGRAKGGRFRDSFSSVAICPPRTQVVDRSGECARR